MHSKQYEFYRLLVADEIGLLDDDDKSRLEAALVARPGVDRASFAEELRQSLADEAPDDDMLTRIAEAERDLVAPVASGEARPAVAWRRRRMWRVGVVAAASVAVVWFAGRLVRGPGDAPAPALTVRLDVMRDGGVPMLDLDASAADRVLLMPGLRPRAPVIRWELRDGASALVAGGTLPGGDPGDPLPPIDIRKQILRPANSYWLVLLGPGGEVVRQWRFDIE